MSRRACCARRFSGVRISNQKLVIATVERGTDAELRLCADASSVFELAGREQSDLLCLFDEVQSFAMGVGLASLVVRGCPAKGSYRGSGLGFKIEALLQFLPDVIVEVIPAMTITCWDQRTDPVLPEPDRPRLGYALSKLQGEAIMTAAWAEERPRDELVTVPQLIASDAIHFLTYTPDE